MTKQRFKDTKPASRSYKSEKVRQYNDQRKKDKQWPKEKGQTMTKGKMTNNDQRKKDKQWSIKHYTIQIEQQETHKKRKKN